MEVDEASGRFHFDVRHFESSTYTRAGERSKEGA